MQEAEIAKMSFELETHFIVLFLGVVAMVTAKIAYTYFERTSLAKPLMFLGAGYSLYLIGTAVEATGLVLYGQGGELVPGLEFEKLHGFFEAGFVVVTLYGLHSFSKAFQTFNWSEAKTTL